MTPVFVSSNAVLQAKLRLSGIPSGLDGEAILHEAMLIARVLFVNRLGALRVAELQAIPFVDTAVDDTSMLRQVANVCEVKVVVRELMRRLKMVFLDAAGKGIAAWNEEAPFREMGIDEIETELTRLDVEIESYLAILGGSVNISSDRFDAIGPTEVPPRPYDSLVGVGVLS